MVKGLFEPMWQRVGVDDWKAVTDVVQWLTSGTQVEQV